MSEIMTNILEKRWIRLAFLLIIIITSQLGMKSQVIGQQTPSPSSSRQADIEEARRLSIEVVQMIGRGEYDEAMTKAMRALEIRERVFGLEHQEVASALVNIGFIYFRKNDYIKARELYQRALSIHEKTLGPEDPETANTLNNLALLHQSEGDHINAEKFYKRALVIHEKTLQEKPPGIEHARAATTMNNLGLIFHERGEYQAAEQLFRRALTIHEKVSEPDNLAITLTLTNLALVHYQTSRYGDAVRLLNQAVDIIDKNFKQDPPDVLPVLSNLLMLYVQGGNYDKAESLSQRTFDLIEKHPGGNFFHITIGYNSIGQLHMARGDYKKAESFYRRAIETLERASSIGHPYAAEVLTNIGLLYLEQDEYAKAKEPLQRAKEMRQIVFGAEHPNFATSLANVAELHRRKGEHGEAESMFKQALAIYQKSLGEQHPSSATVINYLGWIYAAKGDYKTAKEFYDRALKIRRDALGTEHPETAATMNSLADLNRTLGYFDEAEGLFQQALAVYKKSPGPRHPWTANVINNLGLLYLSKGELKKAEDLLQEALSLREQALRPGHQDIATSLSNLAAYYIAVGKLDKAGEFLQRALPIFESSLGPDHPSVARTLGHLATLHQWKGELDKAEPFLRRAITINEKNIVTEYIELTAELISLAEIYHSRGDLNEAEKLYNRVVGIYEKSQTPKHIRLAIALKALSFIYNAKGDIARALDLASRASEVEDYNLDLLLARGSDDQNRGHWLRSQASTMSTISLHTHDAPNNKFAARLALTTVLRRKGRVLDARAESMQSLRDRLNQSDKLSQEDKDLFDKLTEVRSQVAALIAHNPTTSGTVSNPTQLAKLEEEHRRLQAMVSSRNAEFREQSKPISIESIQSLIPEGAALIEFVSYRSFNAKALKAADRWGPRRYVAYVLHHTGEVAWKDLGEAHGIEDAIWYLRIALRNHDQKDVKVLARAADEKIMRPIRRLLGKAKLLLISPDVSLHLIPFEALVDEQGRYLAERYSFAYLSSARDLRRLQFPAPSRQPPVIVANPDFGNGGKSGPEVKTSPADSTGLNLQSPSSPRITYTPLTGTEEEADQIAKLLPHAQVLKGAEATAAALKQVHGPAILHIATHGFFPRNVPWISSTLNMTKIDGKEVFKPSIAILLLDFPRTLDGMEDIYSLSESGIVLAGANNREKVDGEDGILTAFEVIGLDLRGTKLVVLSACETAIGNVEMGAGVDGLRRALMLAGAESQVMSLWKVDDKTTRDVMVAFYTRLRAGEGRSEALRQVRLDMLKSQKYNHPYFWASFIQSGDWRSIDAKWNQK